MTSPERSAVRQIGCAVPWLGLLPIPLALPWPQALRRPLRMRTLLAILLAFIGLFAAGVVSIAMVLIASGRVPLS